MRESYPKDVFVKAEPGGNEAKSEVDCNGEMPRVWCGILAPEKIHVRIRTNNFQKETSIRYSSTCKSSTRTSHWNIKISCNEPPGIRMRSNFCPKFWEKQEQGAEWSWNVGENERNNGGGKPERERGGKRNGKIGVNHGMGFLLNENNDLSIAPGIFKRIEFS